jgi:glutamate/tyrosine decarboxylase-like PLP-dependent enzyme
MLYVTEMSQRARAVELWAALKSPGAGMLDQLVGALHDRAKQFARELQAAGFSILNQVAFNQVLAGCESDDKTHSTIEHVQRNGGC